MILVTGATGIIGREHVPQLLEAGEQVRASGIKIIGERADYYDELESRRYRVAAFF